MGEDAQGRAGQDPTPVDKSTLRVASEQDAALATHRTERLEAILARADARDQAAERRDRAAETRGTRNVHRASIDRDWAGRDRDDAAADRADLIGLLKPPEPEVLGDTEDPL